jgi:hypothetical protein
VGSLIGIALAIALPLLAVLLGAGVLRGQEIAAKEARSGKSAAQVKSWGVRSLALAPLFLIGGIGCAFVAYRLFWTGELRELRGRALREVRFVLVSSPFLLGAAGIASAVQLLRTGWSLLRFSASEELWLRGWGPRDDRRPFHVFRVVGGEGVVYVQGYQKKQLAVAHARELASRSEGAVVFVTAGRKRQGPSADLGAAIWRSDRPSSDSSACLDRLDRSGPEPTESARRR